MKRLLSLILICLILAIFVFAQNNSFELKLNTKFNADLHEYGQIGFSLNGKYFFALEHRKKLQVLATEPQKYLYAINGKFEYGAKISPNG